MRQSSTRLRSYRNEFMKFDVLFDFSQKGYADLEPQTLFAPQLILTNHFFANCKQPPISFGLNIHYRHAPAACTRIVYNVRCLTTNHTSTTPIPRLPQACLYFNKPPFLVAFGGFGKQKLPTTNRGIEKAFNTLDEKTHHSGPYNCCYIEGRSWAHNRKLDSSGEQPK